MVIVGKCSVRRSGSCGLMVRHFQKRGSVIPKLGALNLPNWNSKEFQLGYLFDLVKLQCKRWKKQHPEFHVLPITKFWDTQNGHLVGPKWNYLYEQQIYYCSGAAALSTKQPPSPKELWLILKGDRHNFHGKGIGWICSIQNDLMDWFNPFSKKKQGLKLTLLWQELLPHRMEAPRFEPPRAFLKARKPFGVKAWFNQDLQDFHRMHPVEFPGKESKIQNERYPMNHVKKIEKEGLAAAQRSCSNCLPAVHSNQSETWTLWWLSLSPFFYIFRQWWLGCIEFTLLETNIFAPENGWLEDAFPFGARQSFRCKLIKLSLLGEGNLMEVLQLFSSGRTGLAGDLCDYLHELLWCSD